MEFDDNSLKFQGKFYIVYTDTSGFDSPTDTGNAVYVLRSPDPTFQTDVEELTASGFQPYSQVF